jgi:hypothetical protein
LKNPKFYTLINLFEEQAHINNFLSNLQVATEMDLSKALHHAPKYKDGYLSLKQHNYYPFLLRK